MTSLGSARRSAAWLRECLAVYPLGVEVRMEILNLINFVEGTTMTRTEHLLTILAEECSEVAQRVSKALRFGLLEIQPGQSLTNAERIKAEMVDLIAAWGMLCREGVTQPVAPMDQPAIDAKQEKVERFLEFSAGRGLVDDVPGDPTTPHPEAK